MATVVSMLRNLVTKMTQTSDDAGWISDPLRHPDLARMDQRALGDLPMPGFARPRPVATTSSATVLPMQPQAKTPPTGERLLTAC
ncbi:hypothetical protein P6U16_04975 [Rhizobium sp. 32-5/1]|uniref:hypothetical protein n=1 Tax=Rhizobium sp. 32-5/1 TaxID=3019602 RepID=UPI00240D9180|nr:hypothetical protein [Rhizobium sp. 32-5/1]WEZ84069.1 hypothetical protein P6U16_04975 [Rhizobium sp. 32-5/1]